MADQVFHTMCCLRITHVQDCGPVFTPPCKDDPFRAVVRTGIVRAGKGMAASPNAVLVFEKFSTFPCIFMPEEIGVCRDPAV